MKFLDSNILAYAFYNNEFREQCQEAIREGGITNTFCLAEAFHILEKIIDKKTAIKSIKAILKSNIHVVDVDINTIFQAIKKINNYKSSIFDMIHYITMLLNECTSIVTHDNDFDNLEIKREEPQIRTKDRPI